MSQALRLHSQSICDAITRFDVDVARPCPDLLTLRYVITGAIDDLYLPPATTPARADDLWKRTCFEAFIQPAADEAYVELNVAPSGDWAVYRFSGYRANMTAPQLAVPPRVERRASRDRFEFEVSLDLAALPGALAEADWRLGVSAVIEETSGRKSYWALTHPPGKADFHHADGYSHALPRAEP